MISAIARYLAPLWILSITGSLAIAGLDFHLESEALSGPGWRAQGIALKLTQGDKHSGPLRITIQKLSLPSPLPPLNDISLECTDFAINVQQVRCQAGRLRIARWQGKSAKGKISFYYQPKQDRLNFTVTDLALAKGQVSIQADLNTDDWRLELNATAVDAASLSSLLQTIPGWPLAPQTNKGQFNLSASLSEHSGDLDALKFQIDSKALSLATSSGQYASQDLAFQLQGSWHPQNGSFTASLRFTAGQAYLEPVFLELVDQEALAVSVAGRLQAQQLHIDSLSLKHPGVLQAQVSLAMYLGETAKLQKANITIKEARFPAVYTQYIQAFLIDTVLGELQTAGRLRGTLAFSNNAPQTLALELIDVSLDDAQGRFGGQDLNGQLVWHQGNKPQRSQLRWQKAHVYRLEIGSGDLDLESRGDSFRLLEQERIPVLDGAMLIEQLEGHGLGTADYRWQFQGLLTPVSMETLSQALEWPLLAGKLSGMIPAVRYANHRLEVGGALLIRIFGGDITLTNLRLEDPFGPVPKVFANMDLRGLDLLTLTRTFDFGEIEGKLEGRVRDLRLENWQPTHFDARFATPKGDRSRRRVSQRAVQNISALGGAGPTMALSRGFLGMFEAFKYKRLGLSCRLANGICEMNGVAPAGQGYYLVEGSGLPRIDVIGYTRRVDWNELLARLKAAAQSEAPVVK